MKEHFVYLSDLYYAACLECKKDYGFGLINSTALALVFLNTFHLLSKRLLGQLVQTTILDRTLCPGHICTLLNPLANHLLPKQFQAGYFI